VSLVLPILLKSFFALFLDPRRVELITDERNRFNKWLAMLIREKIPKTSPRLKEKRVRP
jgi:hypothetical protein